MRVITFSRKFPAKHPKAGQPTEFVRSIWKSLDQMNPFVAEDGFEDGLEQDLKSYYEKLNYTPKHHTIRAGYRWNVGDWFSPRVWKDKPYQSKQIQIAAPIEILKIFEFEWYGMTAMLNNKPINSLTLQEIAMNDGLNIDDFTEWFKIHPKKNYNGFQGQILCWNPEVDYLLNIEQETNAS